MKHARVTFTIVYQDDQQQDVEDACEALGAMLASVVGVGAAMTFRSERVATEAIPASPAPSKGAN